MQDDAGEKTEQPTARRLQDAREEGRIARSTDLTAALGLLGGLVMLRAFGPSMFQAFTDMTRSIGESMDPGGADLWAWSKRAALASARILLPFLGTLLVISVAATAAQSGIPLTWKKLAPDLSRISPLAGVKRIFSSESIARFVLGLLKMALVGLVAYVTIRGQIATVLSSGGLHPAGVLHMGSELVFSLALRLGLLLLILALADYAFQRWKLHQSLKMTRQEVRDELKRMEGDPILKQRRRQIQARIALQRIRRDVPRADVVVTNPTEFAVALKYDGSSMTAPRVLAKGKDFLALQIRRIAAEHGVPIVQRPPLARALYASVDIGAEIPSDFYKAVAELLAYVYQLNRRAADGRIQESESA